MRQSRRQHVEPVGSLCFEPMLELIGNGLRRSNQGPMSTGARDSFVQLADAQVVALGQLIEQRLSALPALGDRQVLRKWPINRISRQIDITQKCRQQTHAQHRIN